MTFEEYKKLKRERTAVCKALKLNRAAYNDARRAIDRLTVRLREINEVLAQ